MRSVWQPPQTALQDRDEAAANVWWDEQQQLADDEDAQQLQRVAPTRAPSAKPSSTPQQLALEDITRAPSAKPSSTREQLALKDIVPARPTCKLAPSSSVQPAAPAAPSSSVQHAAPAAPCSSVQQAALRDDSDETGWCDENGWSDENGWCDENDTTARPTPTCKLAPPSRAAHLDRPVRSPIRTAEHEKIRKDEADALEAKAKKLLEPIAVDQPSGKPIASEQPSEEPIASEQPSDGVWVGAQSEAPVVQSEALVTWPPEIARALQRLADASSALQPHPLNTQPVPWLQFRLQFPHIEEKDFAVLEPWMLTAFEETAPGFVSRLENVDRSAILHYSFAQYAAMDAQTRAQVLPARNYYTIANGLNSSWNKEHRSYHGTRVWRLQNILSERQLKRGIFTKSDKERGFTEAPVYTQRKEGLALGDCYAYPQDLQHGQYTSKIRVAVSVRTHGFESNRNLTGPNRNPA